MSVVFALRLPYLALLLLVVAWLGWRAFRRVPR
jgi:hypothetical protein